MVDTEAGGCLTPEGGRFELREGEGEECEDFAPLRVVCTDVGGGRFIFWWGCGWGNIGGSSVAITISVVG